MDNIAKKALIFGVFDGLHEGHTFFIKKALSLCKNLVIVVTPDRIVSELKKRSPSISQKGRMLALKNKFPETKIILGDEKLNSWEVLHEQNPDLLILGYDQKEMLDALQNIKNLHNFDIKIIKEDHKGNILHSSLLG